MTVYADEKIKEITVLTLQKACLSIGSALLAVSSFAQTIGTSQNPSAHHYVKGQVHQNTFTTQQKEKDYFVRYPNYNVQTYSTQKQSYVPYGPVNSCCNNGGGYPYSVIVPFGKSGHGRRHGGRMPHGRR